MTDTNASPRAVPYTPRSTPQTPKRKQLPDGFEWDYSVGTMKGLVKMPPDEWAVYCVVDAHCKGYRREMGTQELLDFLVDESTHYSARRIRDAIKWLYAHGYIDAYKDGKEGMFRFWVIWNPSREQLRDHLVPQSKPLSIPSRAGRARGSKSTAPKRMTRPQCVAVKADGAQCKRPASADQTVCHKHPASVRVSEIDKQTTPPCVSESTPRELSESTHVDPPPVSISDTQAPEILGQSAEREGTDRTALPCTGACRSGTGTLESEYPPGVDDVPSALAHAHRNESRPTCPKPTCGLVYEAHAEPGERSCLCQF